MSKDNIVIKKNPLDCLRVLIQYATRPTSLFQNVVISDFEVSISFEIKNLRKTEKKDLH